jgi:hypothetical protein
MLDEQNRLQDVTHDAFQDRFRFTLFVHLHFHEFPADVFTAYQQHNPSCT